MVQYTQYYKYNILSDCKNNTDLHKRWRITIIAIVHFKFEHIIFVLFNLYFSQRYKTIEKSATQLS